MSIHPSLRGADALIGDRSVLTRFERIQQLIKEEKFDESQDSVFGLPKVRTKFKVSAGKKAEAIELAKAEALGEGGEDGEETPAEE
jgi:small basic protein (TIGR04137 family)